MGFDAMVLLTCACMWLIHTLGIVRAPIARAWPALVVVAVGVGISIASLLFVEAAATHVAVGAVIGLLLLPALAIRAASRALRFGRIGRARALARVAAWLRPLPIQRSFRRSLEVIWRLSRGETLDLDRALAGLGAMGQVEREAHRVALLSWTSDFPAMAAVLADARVLAFALRAGMAAIVISVTGETGTTAELVKLFRKLDEQKTLTRRTLDAALALTALAAYLGDVETVRSFASELRRDMPGERVAFLLATAEQRAGNASLAEEIIERALAEPSISVSGRERLLHRRSQPLEAVPSHERDYAQKTVEAVRTRLRARQALAVLGLGLSRPAPWSWGAALVLTLVFAWQTTEARRAVFETWGLVAPFAEAPDVHRLLTYAMLHVDVGHLVVNLLGLLVFGRFVEHHFGAWRWGLVYVGGALSGGLAFLLFSIRLGVAIGASGAVLALFGATLARIAFDRDLRRSAQGRRELVFLLGIGVAQLVGDLWVAESSGSAHAGGLLAGVLLGALFTSRPRAR